MSSLIYHRRSASDLHSKTLLARLSSSIDLRERFELLNKFLLSSRKAILGLFYTQGNLIKSNRNQIVFTILSSYSHLPIDFEPNGRVRLVPNQLESGKYNSWAILLVGFLGSQCKFF